MGPLGFSVVNAGSEACTVVAYGLTRDAGKHRLGTLATSASVHWRIEPGDVWLCAKPLNRVRALEDLGRGRVRLWVKLAKDEGIFTSEDWTSLQPVGLASRLS
jgi:hypothetical protein